MRHNLITTLVIFFALFSLVQTGMTIYYASQVSDFALFTGNVASNQGSVNLCINAIPQASFNCNTSLTEEVYYECQINASDYDGDNLTFYADLGNYNLTYELNSSSGLFSAIPTNDESFQDSITVNFTIVDSSSCPLNSTTLSVDFDISSVNDAPIYLPNYNLIPALGPFTLSSGVTTRGIYLNNYFSDPDGDALTYSTSISSSDFSAVILPSSEMILGATDCGTAYMFVRATDPYSLFVESGLVSLEIDCSETPSSSGGGGGGGGAPRQACVSQWDCGSWGSCLANGTQKRTCVDIYACTSTTEKFFWRECDYIEQCHNGIQDFFYPTSQLNEDGVDCGGPCDVCPTCFDGLLNNEEVETDCGGPNCAPCMSCFDGIQNYGETGLDCGGYCNPCPSCFDGVKNQNEEGVDCGGNCPACRRTETPELLGRFSNSILRFLIPLAALLLVGGVVYRIFRVSINSFLARFVWLLVASKKKQVLISTQAKNDLLSQVSSIEHTYTYSSDPSLSSYSSAISRTLKNFFDYLLNGSSHKSSAVSQINRLKTSTLSKSLLLDYYSSIEFFDSSKNMSVESLNLSLELLRQLIIDFGPTSKHDVARPVHEVELFDSNNAIYVVQLLYNAIIALEFEEVSIARSKYLDALGIYSSLSESDKELTYGLLHLTFKNISYVSSYSS